MDVNEDLADLYRQQMEMKKKLSKIQCKIVKIEMRVSEEVIIKTMSEVLDNDQDFINWFIKRKKKIENRERKQIIKNKLNNGESVLTDECLPNSTYVYSLYDRNELVYIGITKDLYNRIKDHKKTKIFDRYEVLNIFKDRFYALREENNLIKIHKPKYNKQYF
jgi:predicted GIY-YIG superfamily endonuclease